MARRRRDLSRFSRSFCSLSCFYEFFLLVIWLFKPVYPEISNTHPLLIPLFDVAFFDIATRWFPASHLRPLLNPRVPKTTCDEVFVSICAIYVKPEICLLLSNLRILVRSTTINNKKRRWCPAISILLSQLVSPLPKSSMVEPINSRSEVLCSLWFSSYAFVGLPCKTPTLSPSPYDGCCSPLKFLPAKRNLVSQLVGLFSCSPLSFQKPISKKGDPNCFILKPRSVFTFPLSILSQCRYRFISFVRRLQTEENASLSLWMYKISLRTLLLDSPRISEHERLSFTKKGFMPPSPNYLRTLPSKSFRITSHVFRRLKKNGIMIPSPRRSGYRSFFRSYSPYPLIVKTTHMRICFFRKEPHTPKSLKPKSGLIFLLQTGYKLCVELLNLHGRRGFHARENPPVMLRSCTYPLGILVSIASPRTLSLSNVSSSSCFQDEYKQHALITTSIRYDLSKPNSQSSTSLAINLNQWSNTTFAQTLVKALPRVVLLVPARSTSLAPSQTPFRLLTLANQSSFDSLWEDLLIILDLTCIKKLHSLWFKALKTPLSTNRFYHFISFMLALGSALSYCILNFGISDSSYLCTWFLL